MVTKYQGFTISHQVSRFHKKHLIVTTCKLNDANKNVLSIGKDLGSVIQGWEYIAEPVLPTNLSHSHKEISGIW